MIMRKRHVPIFMAASDATLPYLAATLESVFANASDDCVYDVRILTSGLAQYNRRRIRRMLRPNLDISIVDVDDKVRTYRPDLEERLGDFYTEECFCPFIIAPMYPRITKALYIECGTVLRVDAEILYKTEVGNAILSGYSYRDDVPDFENYARHWVGVSAERYVSPGIMLMNLEAMRKNTMCEKFKRLLTGYNFDTAYPVSDYLNFLCRGYLATLDDVWCEDGIRYAATFSPYRRPWLYANTDEAQEFWDFARKTPFYEDVRDVYLDFTEEKREKHERMTSSSLMKVSVLAEAKGGFFATLGDNFLITKK